MIVTSTHAPSFFRVFLVWSEDEQIEVTPVGGGLDTQRQADAAAVRGLQLYNTAKSVRYQFGGQYSYRDHVDVVQARYANE